MHEDEKDFKLNALLDSMLSDYSAVEPRPGLESRIRAHLRAHTARRQQWMLSFAAAAAVVVLMIFIGIRRGGPHLPSYASIPRPHPEVPVTHEETMAPLAEVATLHLGVVRHGRASRSNSSLLVLKIANSTAQAGSLVFQEQKLYLPPEVPSEPEPAAENSLSPEDLGIESLSVEPVEVKELAPTKDQDPDRRSQATRIAVPLP